MNITAYEEHLKNLKHIQYFKHPEGGKVCVIDTDKATYMGKKIRDLSSFYRRKFENALFFRDTEVRIFRYT